MPRILMITILMREDQAAAALLVIDALERARWRAIHACKLIGMNRWTFTQVMGQLGLRGIAREHRRHDWEAHALSTRHTGVKRSLLIAARERGEECARALLRDAIAASRGNVVQASRLLGCSYSAFKKHVQQLGLWRELYQARRRGTAREKAWNRAAHKRRKRWKANTRLRAGWGRCCEEQTSSVAS